MTKVFLVFFTLISPGTMVIYFFPDDTAWNIRVLTRNFGRITFLRYLGKSVKLKAYQCHVRHVKHSWGSGSFCLGLFILKISLYTLFFGPFPLAKTTYKLLWNSEYVKDVTKALIKREKINKKTYLDLIGKFVLVGKMTLYSICEGWLNPWIYSKEVKKSQFEVETVFLPKGRRKNIQKFIKW